MSHWEGPRGNNGNQQKKNFNFVLFSEGSEKPLILIYILFLQIRQTYWRLCLTDPGLNHRS